jgi:hypothetical protein
VVLLFPTWAEISREAQGGPRPHVPLVEVLEQAGVPTIDLTGPLGAEARRSSVGQLMAKGGHYNAAGNAVVAQTVAEELPGLTADTCQRS